MVDELLDGVVAGEDGGGGGVHAVSSFGRSSTNGHIGLFRDCHFIPATVQTTVGPINSLLEYFHSKPFGSDG
jgi:hypothetical protein